MTTEREKGLRERAEQELLALARASRMPTTRTSNLIRDLLAALDAAEADEARWHQARWQLVDFGVYSSEQAAETAIDLARSKERNP